MIIKIGQLLDCELEKWYSKILKENSKGTRKAFGKST